MRKLWILVLAALVFLSIGYGFSQLPRAKGDAPVTYTVEPFDMDGVYGITMAVTQLQFGGRYCPCVKVPYPATR
jgi:hypothetical protein